MQHATITFFAVLFTSKSVDGPVDLQYGFVYIAHPRAVTHLSWRTTSKYMPKYVSLKKMTVFFKKL